jgi:hypothetical protein
MRIRIASASLFVLLAAQIHLACGRASEATADEDSGGKPLDGGVDSAVSGPFGPAPPPSPDGSCTWALPGSLSPYGTSDPVEIMLPECVEMGSGASEAQRDPAAEGVTVHRITHDLLIGRTEVTRAQWKAMGFVVPFSVDGGESASAGCLGDACPVDGVTWQEALAYANAFGGVSTPPCFDLSACTGTVGIDFACASIQLNGGISSVTACEGYRLPTVLEWEVAARGHSLAYVESPPPPTPTADCWDVTSLDAVAWYCHNAGGAMHHVLDVLPNGFGLSDMLGNADSHDPPLLHGPSAGTSASPAWGFGSPAHSIARPHHRHDPPPPVAFALGV